jgi:hypothetical protein
MRRGHGDTTRYIPLHTLATKVGPLCNVLPAPYNLTGSDETSQFGTKAAGLKAEHLTYLVGFGLNPNDPNLEKTFEQAEMYLVQVLKRNSPCKSTDELRY